ARRAGVVAEIGLREEETARPSLVIAVDAGEGVGPRIVGVLGRKIVAQGAEDAEAAQRAQDGHFGGLIEEAVRGSDAESSGRGGAVAVGALQPPGVAHAG